MSARVSQPVLSTRGLTQDYPGMRALDGFDMDLAQGEIHGVVGANGAGKSTLIKILSGHQTPTSGTITISGTDAAIRNATTAQRLGISVVHQELPLLPNLTAAQNMGVGREIGGLFAPARHRRLERAYRDVARGFPGAPPASHRLESEGLFAWQVVAIVRAMAADAKVLVLDEPTSSLSVDERNVLHARLRDLAGEGLAVIYVSHFLDDILDVAGTVSVLRDGKLVHRGPTSALNEDLLLAHMTGVTAAAASTDVEDALPAVDTTTGSLSPGLELTDLRVGATALDRLSVRPGEIVGLYGLEDSGARDVVEGVFGLRPRTGVVSWVGRTLAPGPRQAIRAGVTLVTGDRKRAGIPRWSVEANHALPRLSQRFLFATRPGRSMRRGAQLSITDFGIKATAGQQLGMLSGGNQQKLLLARWVHTAPTMCLLLDEPTHGVDVSGRRAIYEQLRHFAARGNAVLLHSTDPEEIVELSNRAIPFSGGRPLAEIARRDLTIDRLEHSVRASARHDRADAHAEVTA